MSFFSVEEKIDGLLDLLVVYLSVKILVNHLGPLLRCDIGEQVGA